jgi:hypothetical protein
MYPGQPEYPLEAASPQAMTERFRLSANKSGQSAEVSVKSLLERLGFPLTGKKFMGIGIFGEEITPDNVIAVRNKAFPNGFCIEVKQAYGDSSLQRQAIYYLVSNSINYECPVFLVCQGPGLTALKSNGKPTVLEWARQQAEERQRTSSGTAKFKAAMDIDECRLWLEAIKLASEKKAA